MEFGFTEYLLVALIWIELVRLSLFLYDRFQGKPIRLKVPKRSKTEKPKQKGDPFYDDFFGGETK